MGKRKGLTKSAPMVMKDEDIAVRRRLLERWGFVCIVCGRDFANLACVTKEHVVPKSAPDHAKLEENLAPSHWRCNQMRRTDSLLVAARTIDMMEQKLGPREFINWLNVKVPHRTVPPVALMPVRQRQFMELPDHLPGMSR